MVATHVDNLHYTLLMGNNDVEESPELAKIVWVSGELGEIRKQKAPKNRNMAVIQFTQKMARIKFRQAGEMASILRMTKHQTHFDREQPGTQACIFFAEHELPDNAQVVDVYETPAGQVVVIEASNIQGNTNVGLGLGRGHFGQTGNQFDKVRIHIQTPLFVPVIEEIFFEGKKVSEINIGPDFFHFGEQLAPQTMAHHQIELHFDLKSWTLAATFNKLEIFGY